MIITESHSINMFTESAIKVQNDEDMLIAELIYIKVLVKLQNQSVDALIKNSAKFSLVKTADTYFITSQKVISIREHCHTQMQNSNSATIIRVSDCDWAAVFQTWRKFKATDEYKNVNSKLKKKLLDQIRDNLMIERFNLKKSDMCYWSLTFIICYAFD